MLVNEKNQPVNVSAHINSKTHPHVFASLREKLEPIGYPRTMFSIGARAKLLEENSNVN